MTSSSTDAMVLSPYFQRRTTRSRSRAAKFGMSGNANGGMTRPRSLHNKVEKPLHKCTADSGERDDDRLGVKQRHIKIEYESNNPIGHAVKKMKAQSSVKTSTSSKLSSAIISDPLETSENNIKIESGKRVLSEQDGKSKRIFVGKQKVGNSSKASVSKRETSTDCAMSEDTSDGHGKEKGKKNEWEPVMWRAQLENLREMRKNKDAPVDSMGAEKICDSSAAPEVNS